MPLNSVNTNVGARAAVRYAGITATELATSQRRIASGLKVASARDNGAVWAIAQSQRGDAGAIGVIITGLQRSESALDVALSSGTVVADLLSQMKEKALAASDEGLNSGSRAALDRDFGKLRDQITRVVKAAEFDGVNLISSTSLGYEIRAGLGVVTETYEVLHPNQVRFPGRTQTKTREGASMLDVRAEDLALGGANVTVTATDALSDAATSRSLVTKLNASIQNTSDALARVGANSKQLARQQAFLRKMQDGLLAGVGNLVDADLGREAARFEALQTRQQLGLQAMSIANAAPGVLLGLFR